MVGGGEMKGVAAIWWRVSTADQLDRVSPETQIQEAKQMLEENGYVVPDEFILGADWSSLAILDCPQMSRLLDLVRQKRIQAIGVYHTDRLSGRPAHKIYILDLCAANEVRILSKHSPVLAGPEGELVEYIHTWAKEIQVLRAQQASKDGLRDRVLIKRLPVCSRAVSYTHLTLPTKA